MNIKEAAADCGRSVDTIRRWIKKRGLKAEKVGFNGEIFIPLKEWGDFCSEHGIQRGRG